MKLADYERRVLADLSGGWAEAVAKGIWSEDQNPIAGGAWNQAREALGAEGLLCDDLMTLTGTGWGYVDRMLYPDILGPAGDLPSRARVCAFGGFKRFLGGFKK